MKLRNMQGIAQQAVSFDEINQTHVHRQAVLCDIVALGRGGNSPNTWAYDPLNRVWSNSHLFRASVTLAGEANV